MGKCNNSCKCNNKCNNSCKCNNNNNCDKCSINDVYMFLGEYTYNLLNQLDLPCGHPSVKDSICLLLQGQSLPCGHPTLDELLKQALNQNNCGCHNCNRR